MPFARDTQYRIFWRIGRNAYCRRQLVYRFIRREQCHEQSPASNEVRPSFPARATYLAGYYKYKAGDQFTEGGKPVEGKRDICDIYAIMYETSVSVPTLDGTNAFTSPNLVSMARIKDAKETDEWTYFKLPFTTLPGKFIDKEKLTMGKYNISIVFTSSLEGDHFNGAIGSTLLIDEAELIYRSDLDH